LWEYQQEKKLFQMQQVSNKEKLFFLYFAIFLIFLIVIIAIRNDKLTKEGVYTLGTIVDIQDVKSGKLFSVDYFLKGQKFHISFSDIGHSIKKGQLLYIKVSSKSPEIYNVIDYFKITVPDCFKISDVPQEGWKNLPLNPCK
jgi:hypothetical protein